MIQFKESHNGHKSLVCPFELKDIGDTGTFTGYGSIYGNVDQGMDIVERGAFKEVERTKDGKVRILYQHRTSDPIGKASFQDEIKGLYLDGELVMGMSGARNAHAGMKAGILDGLSIGYDVLPNGSEEKEGIRHLLKLKLWEVSVVTFGMNTLARIDTVKSAQNIKTIREFEEFLRDVGGYSVNAAKAIAAAGFKEKSKSQSRDASEAAELKRLTEVIGGFSLGDPQPSAFDSIRNFNF